MQKSSFRRGDSQLVSRAPGVWALDGSMRFNFVPPHIARCKRLLPFGKKKDGKQYGPGRPEVEPAPAAADGAFDDFGSGLSQDELEWLRRLFDEHDTNHDEQLDEGELGALLGGTAAGGDTLAAGGLGAAGLGGGGGLGQYGGAAVSSGVADDIAAPIIGPGTKLASPPLRG